MAGLNSFDICSLTRSTQRRVSRLTSISRPLRPGRISRSVDANGVSKMSEVECAGSVETRSTRLPCRLAASATAAAHVVLPTPPLPPKKRILRSKSWRIRSTAGQIAERRVLESHSPVPEVELVQEIRIDFQQVQGHGIRQTHQLQVAEEHEQIVQLHGLLAQVLLVASVRHPLHEGAGVCAELLPIH